MTEHTFLCPACGRPFFDPDHEAHCDAQQGGVEPDEEATTPQDLDEARYARDVAIAEVDAHAREAFMEAASETIRSVARRRVVFVIDDVWAARASWPRTHDKRAMGAAMLQAKRDGLIAPTDDFRSTAQVLRHAAPVRVWRSLIAGAA